MLTLVAPNDGYVHFLTQIEKGIGVQANQTLFEVSENKDYLVEAYIQAQDISKIKEGQSINVALAGVNQAKFGTLKGVLVKIDRGTIIQQTSQGNVALYKIEVLLDKTSLSNDEEVIHVYKSMPVEARVIYQQESYFEWLLEQLNFMK